MPTSPKPQKPRRSATPHSRVVKTSTTALVKPSLKPPPVKPPPYTVSIPYTPIVASTPSPVDGSNGLTIETQQASDIIHYYHYPASLLSFVNPKGDHISQSSVWAVQLNLEDCIARLEIQGVSEVTFFYSVADMLDSECRREREKFEDFFGFKGWRLEVQRAELRFGEGVVGEYCVPNEGSGRKKAGGGGKKSPVSGDALVSTDAEPLAPPWFSRKFTWISVPPASVDPSGAYVGSVY